MNEDINEVLFNRQVNYLIIEKLWKYNGKSIYELYNLLGITQNTYSRIRTADQYHKVNLDKEWDKKGSGLQKLGLSKEIMTGKKMIEIDGIEKKDWEEYWQCRNMKKEDDKANVKSNNMAYFMEKLRKALKKLSMKETIREDIDRLYYFVIHGRPVDQGVRDIEMQDLKTSLNRIDIQKIKVCNNELREEICKLLKERYDQVNTVIQYYNLK